MAEFRWQNTPKQGVCITCGTSANDRGFVDMIADVDVKNPMGEITGNIDIVMCALCLEQAARMVGSATKQETDELVQKAIEAKNEAETLRDEVAAWTQRHFNLVDKLSQDTKEKLNV